MIWRELSLRVKLRISICLLLVFIAIFGVLQLFSTSSQLVKIESNYAIHIRQNFNQPAFWQNTEAKKGNLNTVFIKPVKTKNFPSSELAWQKGDKGIVLHSFGGIHDDIATIFWKHGALLQILRTNQVGGWQPDIIPLAPTVFFGQIKLPFTDISPLSILLNRILASLAIPTFPDSLVISITLIIYSMIALPLGFKFGFLQLQIWSANSIDKSLLTLRCLFLPAIVEELFFRVLLLPHPNEITNWFKWGLWAFFTILLFVIYHPLNAKYFYKAGFPTFFNPVFLGLAGLLGIACTIAYGLTGSLLVIVLIHWVIVVFWLIIFGGITKLSEL